MGCRIVHMDTAAGTACTNTTTETSLCGYDFAAGELLPEKRYEFTAVLNTTASAGQNLTAQVRFGSSATASSNTSVASSGAVAGAANDMSVISGFIEVHSTTRYVIGVYYSEVDAAGEAVLLDMLVFTATAQTAYYLDITATWGAAAATESVRSEAFTVIELTQG